MPLPLTYPDVGATAGALPAGYRHTRRSDVLGRGDAAFARASEALLGWEMHRRAGLAVRTDCERVELGCDVHLGLRLATLRVTAPCRVVRLVDEARARGFAYGTLAGHPECGEEAFVVRLGDDGAVSLEIVAFSRPARWFSRLGEPVARVVQARITDRYVAALRDP